MGVQIQSIDIYQIGVEIAARWYIRDWASCGTLQEICEFIRWIQTHQHGHVQASNRGNDKRSYIKACKRIR